MKIISCHIENFGKLNDFTMDFCSTEKNVVFKENGWGKSTLAAFIKVMFYGFDNEGKRDDYENERRRFKPWQGGVYGGQLVFEAGGKTYEASRIFGAKDKEDVFVLKENDTGIESKDFSERLGEDLFGLDSKSFVRSIFVSQDACETSVTDGISAKLGNLTESTDDINNYERADKRLNDILNSMSPRRKTGELSRQKDEITGLKQIIAQGKNIEKTLDNLLRLSQDERACIEGLKKEQKVWSKKQQILSVYKDKELKKNEYERICKNYSEMKAEYDKEGAWFKNGVPEQDELKEIIEDAYSLSDKKSAFNIYELNEAEKAKLSELKDVINEEKENIDKEKEELERLKAERETDKTVTDKTDKNDRDFWLKGLFCLAVGIVSLLIAIVIKKLILFVGVAVVLAIIIAFVRLKNRSEEKDDDETEDDGVLGEKEERIKELEKHYEQNSFIMNSLKEKQDNYVRVRAEYERTYNKVKKYLYDAGFVPEDDMYRQLDDIDEKARNFVSLKNSFEKLCKEKELFEMNNDVKELQKNTDISGTLSLSETNENLRRISDEIEAHNKNIAGYSRQIDEYEEKLEYISECENELEKISEVYESNKHKYKILEKTKEMLEEAKAAFTAKYTAPIKQGFDKYYNMITGNSDNTYKLDANIRLSHKEMGLDRDTKFLSMGYKDLVGVCMRMALVDAMYAKEKPFIIFDDSFVNLDKDKLEAGIRLLDSIAGEYQIIYFTCHESRI